MSKLINLANQVYYISWASLFRRDLLKPTYSISNFSELEIPSHTKLVILDKDNCFAKPHSLTVWPAFQQKWDEIIASEKKSYEVVVLSNTAGNSTDDPQLALANQLTESTGLPVISHSQKKPMCYLELSSLKYNPRDILVVGDRLATDVLLANLMGAESVWIRPGAHPSILNRMEIRLFKYIE